MAGTKKTTATRTTTAGKATAGKTTARKTTARKTTARKTTPRKTTARSASKKATRKTTSAATSAPRATALLDREPVQLLETAGYAATSIVTDAITLARDPERFERVETNLNSLRERLGSDLERTLSSFTRVVDSRAADGRKVVGDVVKRERVARVLEQTANTRSQLRAALTSVTRTADVAGVAAGKQAGTARSQVKGASTAVRRSTGQARSQVKGAATSVRRIADVAAEAAGQQVPNARSHVKAAATSVRKSAGTIATAAADTAADAEARTAS